MQDLESLPQMDREWRAWRLLCELLGDYYDLNINTNKTLHTAITAWGEELAMLRRAQKREDAERVLGEHRAEVTASTILVDLYRNKVNV